MPYGWSIKRSLQFRENSNPHRYSGRGDVGNGSHCPLTRVDTVEHSEATDTPGFVDDHELRGRRPHVVGNDGYVLHSQLTKELQHPSSLASHVDTRAGWRLGFAVTDEIWDEHAKTGVYEHRAHVGPQTPSSRKTMQQKKRETLTVVFQTDSSCTDLDGAGHQQRPHKPEVPCILSPSPSDGYRETWACAADDRRC